MNYHLVKADYIFPTGEGEVAITMKGSLPVVVPGERWEQIKEHLTLAVDPRLEVTVGILVVKESRMGFLRFQSLADNFLVDRFVDPIKFVQNVDNDNYLYDVAVSVGIMFEEENQLDEEEDEDEAAD